MLVLSLSKIISPRISRAFSAGCLLLSLGACAANTGLLLQADTLDQAFRIDIQTIDVVYDIHPDEEYVDGRSEMSFVMREGQTRPLFHFDPWTPIGRGVQDSLKRVVLDGVEIPVSELVRARVEGSDERVFEIERELAAGEHRLEFEWSLWNWFLRDEPGWFRTVVDDSSGMGNETLWPTINSPEELARHRLEFRVHSDVPYSAVGSKGVSKTTQEGVQSFVIDTERAVSSYTVMLTALPSEQVSEHNFSVGDVDVRMLSTLDERQTELAISTISAQLYLLEYSFGVLAEPTVDVLLIEWETGMEYFAATTTGMRALSHEMTHLYWGTAAINKTWRDTWLDEAINVWWNFDSAPIEEGFRSDLLSARHSLALGYDDRAYEEGARVLAVVAAEIGEQQMMEFLNLIYQKYLFKPFSTADFVNELVRFSGDERWTPRFNDWVGEAKWQANPLLD